MGKYSTRQVAPPPRPYTVHPVWRGIGCLLLLIGPVIAFAAADMLVQMNQERDWVRVPGEMLRPYTLPLLNYTIERAVATAIVTGALLLIGFAAITIIYSMFYSMMGPPRYSPLDSPPIRERRRRR